jgi:hypothetical protein
MGCTICKNIEDESPRIDSQFEQTGVFNLDSVRSFINLLNFLVYQQSP